MRLSAYRQDAERKLTDLSGAIPLAAEPAARVDPIHDRLVEVRRTLKEHLLQLQTPITIRR